jgi:protein-tyrosine phosphatase
MSPRSVLFVCLGNICRSPVAEGVFKAALVHRFGASQAAQWKVDSAGTSGYHADEAPDPRSQASARRHGVDISMQRSRPFSVADFEDFDHILVMDSSNHVNVLALTEDPGARAKVELMLDASFPDQNKPVPDPYYGGEHGFEQVYQLLAQASEDWLDRWA